VRQNATVTISDERRLVTVLFADLVGFTSRSDASDPEEVRELQRAYFEAVAAEVQRYGGSVEKYIGDAVMALYGAPQAHDDDAERALHAALGIREAVARLGSGLEVRIGVNTGEVVGGAGPGPQAHEYTVTGDAVNVAARLQQAAEPGQIFVGPTTRRLSAEAFDFAPLPPLELKGKAEPVEAWRLARALPVRPRVRGGEAPLVGRRREQLLLESALESAQDGHGLIVGVSGEAGIGKSRLALELRHRAEAAGFGTTWAAALSYASSFPFHLVAALAEALLQRAAGRSMSDALADALPDADPAARDRWASVLADLAGEADPDQRARLAEATPEARQRLLVQALAALLGARAAERPQLVVLDDLHWADASSLAVLDEVLTAVPEAAIVVLALHRASWRNRWANRSSYQQVNLDRLRDDEARQLLGALSGGRDVEAGLAEELMHRSGGNPFFLEQLLRAGEAGTRALPETVHELLLARIDALPAPARAALGVAAVMGMEFDERALADIEPGIPVAEALGELQRDELIVALPGAADHPTYGMRHPLVHEVAYRSLLAARRRELHRRIGAWLEQHGGEEALAAIARHYLDADDRERAREVLPRAAARAERLNAPNEARAMYAEAADLFRDDPVRRADMLERVAFLAYLMLEVDAAIAAITEASALYREAGDELRALDSRRKLGRYYWMNGRGREAEEETIAAVEGLRRLPISAELAHALSARSQLRMLTPDFEAGVRWAEEAIAIADQVGAIAAKVHALNNRGVSRMGLGDPTGLADLQESLRLALEHNMPDDAARAYANMSSQGTAISFFEPDEQEAFFEEMIAYDMRVAPDGTFEGWHRSGRTEQWIARGRWDDAIRELRNLSQGIGRNRYLQSEVASYLALVVAYRGDYEEALEMVRPVVELAVGIEDLQAYAPALLALAHAERGAGHVEAAMAALERGVAVRGETQEANISTFFLFEGVDVVTFALREGAPASAVEGGIRALDALASAVDAVVERAGTAPEMRVRRALYGAARQQLAALHGSPAADIGPRLREAGAQLEVAKRVFDVARIELWAAEASGEAAPSALATFERLRAAPGYAARASRAVSAS
jgi:adenylate cyclase